MLVLVTADPAATSAHGLQAVLYFIAYPAPDWISGPHRVDTLLRAAAVALALGYFAFHRRWRLASGALLLTFCTISAAALGHYLYAPMASLPLLINLLIWLEAGAALLLAAFVIHIQFHWRQLAAAPAAY